MELGKYFDQQLSSTNMKKRKVIKAIKEMTKERWAHPGGPDGSYVTTSLYQYLQCLYPGVLSSIFSLTQASVYGTQKRVMPSLPEEERRDIEEIGKLMRKYINNDLNSKTSSY